MLRRGDGRCKDDAPAHAWLEQEVTGRGSVAGAQAACYCSTATRGRRWGRRRRCSSGPRAEVLKKRKKMVNGLISPVRKKREIKKKEERKMERKNRRK